MDHADPHCSARAARAPAVHDAISFAIETIIVLGRVARPVMVHSYGPTPHRPYPMISVLLADNDRAAVDSWARYLGFPGPFGDFDTVSAPGRKTESTTYRTSGHLPEDSGCLTGAWLEAWCPLHLAVDATEHWHGAGQPATTTAAVRRR